MREGPFTGGCQCGAVRFRATKLGRGSICHCRMCQKATGNFFAPFISIQDESLEWTRGAPQWFRSSADIRRGFCAACGTPLAYEHPHGLEITIGAFDRPEELEPEVQVNHHQRLPWIERLFEKRPVAQSADEARIVSFQHPDHDTDRWPPDTAS
ncbi:GFA family protein [Rhizobiaceae bacterium BDR2-2]|uniref:GFA family protein n=1 Tax=Ectorhizobium quercum TaxID=2965071 RepID=A0AAE3N376_9HYPH|nr:GFA family protein [Ectorhizobium quercum]MCX8999057.1 GFA family protein [Ectorhizobium quercum]